MLEAAPMIIQSFTGSSCQESWNERRIPMKLLSSHLDHLLLPDQALGDLDAYDRLVVQNV